MKINYLNKPMKEIFTPPIKTSKGRENFVLTQPKKAASIKSAIEN
jgi:hypothetical protein